MSEFDAAAFRDRLRKNQQDKAEAHWGDRMRAGGETGRFAARLMKQLSPSELLAQDFPNPIYTNFRQAVTLSDRLSIALEDPDNVGNLLEQGFNDTRDAILDNNLIEADTSLETALERISHPRTLRSIARLALQREEAMRNRMRGGLRTTIDPQTGVLVLDEDIPSVGSREVYNEGCPFASKKAAVDNRSHEATMIFTKFAHYAGEIVARVTVQK